MGLLDQPVFPLDHPDGRALRDGLARHYQRAAKIESLCREAGLAVENLSFSGAPVAVWERILIYAASTTELRGLVEVVARDPESMTIREFLQSLLAQPKEDDSTAQLSSPRTPVPEWPAEAQPIAPRKGPHDPSLADADPVDLGHVRVLTEHQGWVSGLAFSPDGSQLASVGEDGMLILWDIRTGASQQLNGHEGVVHTVSFNGNSLLASGGADHKILLWDAHTAQQVLALPGHDGAVHSVAFGANSLLASGGADRTIRLWDIRNAGPGRILGQYDDIVCRVAFSLDRTLLASAGADRTVRLWTMPGGGNRYDLNRHSGKIAGLAFGPDGTLASTDWDQNSIMLWNSTTRQLVEILPSQGEPLLDLAFSPNGALLAVGGPRDGRVRLWVRATGAWLSLLNRHDGPVTCLAFSRDGTLLASGGADFAVHIWQRSSAPG